jgi:flagellin-like protein
LKKLSKNRKAVSPVLSTIMMIMIVVVGMSVAFGYFVNLVKDYQTGSGGSVMELVSIEDVWFMPDHSTIQIWLYNYGKVAMTVNALYIDGQQQPSFRTIDISINGHNMSSAQFPWNLGTVYHFKFVTARGAAVEGEYVSPN